MKLLLQQKNFDWNRKSLDGLTALTILLMKNCSQNIVMKIINKTDLDVDSDELENYDVLQRAVRTCKSFVSEMMLRKSIDREITKTPLIFALENNLNKNIIKILISGATSQEIVDLVLSSCSSTSSTSMDGNQRKRLKLDF